MATPSAATSANGRQARGHVSKSPFKIASDTFP
jgi:hypothetical protein